MLDPLHAITGQFPLSAQVGQWNSKTLTKGTVGIQTGTISLNALTTNTATITAVNLNNALLIWGGQANPSVVETNDVVAIRMTLTNATTITAIRVTSEAVAVLVRYYVLEFVPGVIKQIQRFTNVALGTQAITTVNLNKAFPLHLGTSTANGTSRPDYMFTAVQLNTAVQATITGQSGNTNFDVVELF